MKKLFAIVCLNILFSASLSQATEAECRSVLHDCDTAVQDLQKENAIQKQLIIDEEDRFKTQSKELSTEQIWKPIALGGGVVIGIETLVLLLKR